MAILGVDDFKAKLRGGGARPNLFQVTINYPGFAGGDPELTSFMVSAASLPGSVMGEILVPFRGRQLKMAGDRTFEQWTTTIVNDTDFSVRNAIERWMNQINQHRQNTGLTNPIEYEADLRVDQLDRSGAKIKSYIFRGAYPANLSEIALDYSSNDIIENFTCTWSYQYYES